MKRIVPIATAVLSVLAVGYVMNQTALSAAKRPATPCQSDSTVFVFPIGSGAAVNGTPAWAGLTGGPYYFVNTASVEAVIPDSPRWRIIRLIVPSANAQAVVSSMHNNSAVGNSGIPIASARACFTGWNRARLSNLRPVSRATWTAAFSVANGMDFIGPAVVQPGHPLYIVVESGSVDGGALREGMGTNTSWYAFNLTTHKVQVPITFVSETVDGTQMLAEFSLPDNVPNGSYMLVFTVDGHLDNHVYTGDFVFQVK